MIIEDGHDYGVAFRWVEIMMSQANTPPPGSVTGDMFVNIVSAVEAWEKKHYPIRASAWICAACGKRQPGRLNANGDDVECSLCGSPKP